MGRAEEKDLYVFVYNKDGRYAGIDHSSGGYPYPTDSLNRAELWSDKKEIIRYQDMFPHLKLHKLDYTLVPME